MDQRPNLFYFNPTALNQFRRFDFSGLKWTKHPCFWMNLIFTQNLSHLHSSSSSNVDEYRPWFKKPSSSRKISLIFTHHHPLMLTNIVLVSRNPHLHTSSPLSSHIISKCKLIKPLNSMPSSHSFYSSELGPLFSQNQQMLWQNGSCIASSYRDNQEDFSCCHSMSQRSVLVFCALCWPLCTWTRDLIVLLCDLCWFY